MTKITKKAESVSIDVEVQLDNTHGSLTLDIPVDIFTSWQDESDMYRCIRENLQVDADMSGASFYDESGCEVDGLYYEDEEDEEEEDEEDA